MKRTIAVQLALVNWRGVFYERYQLDRGVTALEGANGAGKTTVMIAAYVVLLPDQRFLHFEPLTDGGVRGDDRGIWGRLGDGNESYSAIDFRLANGDRLVAGVRLERTGRDGGELHPFLIRGLSPDIQLQQVLLDKRPDHDEVPASDRLAQLAAVAGGRIDWSDSVGKYLQDLFDAGVMPLPLSTDDERSKFNELLRTSMLGGISRRLGEGLRSFLLRPEEGLGETLKRIRGNLDDCRRTRIQVDDSRKLQQEIHDVLEAGAHMFAAAVEGVRRFADEKQRQADEAVRRESEARRVHDSLVSREVAAQAALAVASENEQRASAAADLAEERARQVVQANGIWRKRTLEEARRSPLEKAHSDTIKVHEERKGALRRGEDTVRAREKDHQESAKGMADIQAGLERLHGHASRYRAVQAALRRARAQLAEISFADTEASEVLAQCEGNADAASKRLVAASGRLATAEESERAFRSVKRALDRIAQRPSQDAEALATALDALGRLREADNAVSRLPTLRAEKDKAAELFERQQGTRRKAFALATSGDPITTAIDVRHARDLALEGSVNAQRELAEASERHSVTRSDVASRRAAVEHLEQRADDFRILAATANSVAGRWMRPCEGSAHLAALLLWLQTEVEQGRRAIEADEKEVVETEDELQQLRNAGGSFPRHLTEACDAVDGRLLVDRFDDVPLDRAADVEARLGPLVHAILVTDPEEAARALADVALRPDTTWLVNGQAADLTPDSLPISSRTSDAVMVPDPHGVRLTRLPTTPIVGRQAREFLISRREAELREIEQRLAGERGRVRLLEPDIKVVSGLLPRAALLDGPDPAALLASAKDTLAEAERSMGSLAKKLDSAKRHLIEVNARKTAVEELWPDAGLLDPPDYGGLAVELEAKIAAAVTAQRTLDAIRSDRTTVEHGLDLLRSPPPNARERESLKLVVEAAQAEQARWLTPQPDLLAVTADLEALEFADAERTIRKDEEMLASLNAQVEAASRRLDDARTRRDTAKSEEDEADRSKRDAEKDLGASRQRIADLDEELSRTEVSDASDGAVEFARASASRARAAHRSAVESARRATGDAAALAPQVATAKEKLDEATSDRQDKSAQAGPAVARWNALRERCTDLGLLDAAVADPALDEVQGKASIDVFTLRKSWWDRMLDRLDRAADGKALSDTLRLIEAADAAGSDQFLRAWQETRSWLALRVPKHVSEVNDPVEALGKLRRHLDALVEKLGRFEARLRGDSRDVARSIESRLRKVNNLLTKLKRDLRGVGFGSIEAIRVETEREARMNGILAALSAPEEEQRLFSPDMPIEQALDELFLKHGGKRDGGHRILDYREYVRLRVEVKRRGSDAWEEARGNQLSTGEAIGVGTAIMMVVLTSWEREAGLLRPRRELGSLRFLSLDEATRLSLDSLEVLFGLCADLDLQLLIAAPEVATSARNTTYLLERSTGIDGREVVRAFGRRTTRRDA